MILCDLLTWRDAHVLDRPDVFYWRTSVGEEVDLVIEKNGHLLAIEVKATSRPRAADAKHLRVFRDEYGGRVDGCLLLHTGREVEWLGPRILAAPWWRLM